MRNNKIHFLMIIIIKYVPLMCSVFGVRCTLSYLCSLNMQEKKREYCCFILVLCTCRPAEKMENKFYAYENSIMTSNINSFFNFFSLVFFFSTWHTKRIATQEPLLILIKLCADSILFTFIMR